MTCSERGCANVAQWRCTLCDGEVCAAHAEENVAVYGETEGDAEVFGLSSKERSKKRLAKEERKAREEALTGALMLQRAQNTQSTAAAIGALGAAGSTRS